MKLLKTICICLAVLTMSGGCREKDTGYRTMSGSVWHTTFNITFKSPKDLQKEIVDAMNSVEQSLSPFLDTSLITAINRNESDSTDTYIDTVFLTSQRINKLSGGAFDPTVAPLVNLWGFGYSQGSGEPSEGEITEALKAVGISECSITNGRMKKKSDKTQFNFSAITKGFGCDVVGETLRLAGCDNYMVEIGGELRLAGKNPRGEMWHIQIDMPDENNPSTHSSIAIVEVSDCGIATSGNYRNYRDTEQGRVGHTISPVTGSPITTNILSVTVIAPTTMEADALATACMAMPVEDAKKMIENYENASALFILGDNGKMECSTTNRFPKLNLTK